MKTFMLKAKRIGTYGGALTGLIAVLAVSRQFLMSDPAPWAGINRVDAATMSLKEKLDMRLGTLEARGLRGNILADWREQCKAEKTDPALAVEIGKQIDLLQDDYMNLTGLFLELRRDCPR